MAQFNFDQVDEYVQSQGEGFTFLKLQDHNWSAKVRFMYGPGETFQGFSVHNISPDPRRPKYVPCLRELGQPLDVCPLCKAGSSVTAQFYIPVYVISITKCINGVTQAEEPVNQVMLFQRGKTFQGALSSAIRQSAGTPLVNNIFNIVRNGKAQNLDTTYMVEFFSRDNVSLNDLPERPVVLGSYILPEMTFEKMTALINGNTSSTADVTPRTVSATTAQTTPANATISYVNNTNTRNNVPF